jgi:uncharacterized protein (UPF0548 family)
VLTLRRPDTPELRALLDGDEQEGLSFRHVGARFGKVPPGYRADRYVQALGSGEAVFARACEGLRRFEPHRRAGVTVVPGAPRLRAGTTLLVQLRVGPVHVVGGCRILHVVEEPRRFGFVYATLPSHPEVGEESFTVAWDRNDEVTFEVAALSRWREPVVRLAGPLARLVQVRTTRRYLRGLASYVAEDRSATVDL